MQSIIPTVAVADIVASIRFYTDVFGFAPEMTLPGEDGILVHGSVSRGDTYLMFSRLNPNDPHDTGHLGQGVVLYATIGDDEDIDAYFARAQSAGATVVQEPADQFWGHRDWGIEDPDGYLLFISKVTRDVSSEEMRESMLAGSPAD
jgi:uncharacterized glyoxalase superfamily protein PhnB